MFNVGLVKKSGYKRGVGTRFGWGLATHQTPCPFRREELVGLLLFDLGLATKPNGCIVCNERANAQEDLILVRQFCLRRQAIMT